MSTFPAQRPPVPKAVLCPFCGTAQFNKDRCANCKHPFSEKARKQAQIDMGPWYIRNKESPFLPGYSYEKIKRLAEAGVLKPTSVIRGPSSHQFWLMAKFTPGVSHLVGCCFACCASAKPSDTHCAECVVPFKEYPDRNSLGMRYKTDEEVQKARQELAEGDTRQPVAHAPPKKNERPGFPAFDPKEDPHKSKTPPQPLLAPQAAVMDADKPSAKPFVPGADLLDDIFGPPKK